MKSPMPTAADRRVRTSAVFALGALGALLFGYDNGIVSGAILFVPRDLPLDPLTEGLVVSSAVVGAMVGSIVSGPVADRIGRQRLLIVAGAVFLIGALGAGLAPVVGLLVTSRLVFGLGIGISSVVVPLYLAEMVPASRRGITTSLNQYLIVIGTGAAGGVAFALSFSGSWRWMFAIGVFPAVVLLVGMLVMPDTPRSLIRRGRPEQARSVLHRVRGSADEAEAEFADITVVAREETGTGTGGGGSIRGRLAEHWVRRLLVIGIALAVFQQVTGINAVVYYSPSVLTGLGLSSSQSLLFSFANGALNVITIAVVVQLKAVDRHGRKPLLLIGLGGLVLSTAAIGLVTLLAPRGSAVQIVITIAAFVVFTNVFSATWGPVLWVILAEIFPLRVRGLAMAVATLFNWLAAFVVSQLFPILADAIGAGPVMLAFAVIGLIVAAVVQWWVPETKNRSLEELERDFRAADTPRHAD